MRILFCFLTLFFATVTYADPVKLYDIFNVNGLEFIPRPNETTPQCQEFSKISSGARSSKFIDFEGASRINCIVLLKKDETCGLNVTLNGTKLPEIEPFGNCHLATRVSSETQRIDRIVIGLMPIK